MFCYPCEETVKGSGCTVRDVRGKESLQAAENRGLYQVQKV